jgi:hypothetical protein
MLSNVAMSRWLSFLICLTIGVLFFGDTFILDRTVIPTGALYTEQPWKSESPELAGDVAQQYDLIQQFYPWADYFKRSVREGRLPLWNPYNYLGTPFFANPQTALLFPLTWLHLLLPLRYSFSLILLLKLTISLLGMYYWLRSLRLSPKASLLGSFVFSLSMNTVSSLAFPYSNVTILFPWALLSLKSLLEIPTRKGFAWLTIALALIVFAGQPQSALPAFLALILYTLLVVAVRRATAVQRLCPVAAAFLLAGLITAIQWIPSFAYVAESMVPYGPRIIKSTYPFEIGTLLTLLIPDFFGSILRGDYWGFPGYHYTAFYSSILAVILVPFAFKSTRLRTDPGLLFPALTGLLALGVILGTPPLENLLDIPGFDLLRRHRFSFLLIFCLSELAARGADSIFRDDWQRRTKLALLGTTTVAMLVAALFGFWRFREFLEQLDPAEMTVSATLRAGVLVLAGGAICILMKNRWTSLGLVVMLFLDLALVSHGLNPRGSASSLFPPSELARHLTKEDERPRIFSFHPVFNPNTAMVYGLQDVRGYDVITPRRLFRYMQKIDPGLGNLFVWLNRFERQGTHSWTLMQEAVEDAFERHGDALKSYFQSDSYWTVGISKVENRALFDLLQIEYILGPPAKGLSGFQSIPSSGPIRLLSNPEAIRSKLYFDWKETNESRALTSMNDLDLEQTAVVETSIPSPHQNPVTTETSLQTLHREFERSRYLVESDHPTVLVEFERFSPGWKAVLNNTQKVDVFPAHSIFRAVFIPAGKHEVEFRYEPDSLRYGALLSAAGLLLFLISLLGNLPKVGKI